MTIRLLFLASLVLATLGCDRGILVDLAGKAGAADTKAEQSKADVAALRAENAKRDEELGRLRERAAAIETERGVIAKQNEELVKLRERMTAIEAAKAQADRDLASARQSQAPSPLPSPTPAAPAPSAAASSGAAPVPSPSSAQAAPSPTDGKPRDDNTIHAPGVFSGKTPIYGPNVASPEINRCKAAWNYMACMQAIYRGCEIRIDRDPPFYYCIPPAPPKPTS